MKPVSLADISYEQGLQLLALRKQAMAAGHIQRMPSEALANSFPLRNIGQATVEKLAEGGILDRNSVLSHLKALFREEFGI